VPKASSVTAPASTYVKVVEIYKGLFRLPFPCLGQKKGLGGEAKALAKLGLCSLLLRPLFNRIKNARSGCLHVLKTL
jgi:hypothetical protein